MHVDHAYMQYENTSNSAAIIFWLLPSHDLDIIIPNFFYLCFKTLFTDTKLVQKIWKFNPVVLRLVQRYKVHFFSCCNTTVLVFTSNFARNPYLREKILLYIIHALWPIHTFCYPLLISYSCNYNFKKKKKFNYVILGLLKIWILGRHNAKLIPNEYSWFYSVTTDYRYDFALCEF